MREHVSDNAVAYWAGVARLAGGSQAHKNFDRSLEGPAEPDRPVLFARIVFRVEVTQGRPMLCSSGPALFVCVERATWKSGHLWPRQRGI